MIDIVLIDYEDHKIFTQTIPWPDRYSGGPAPVVQTEHMAVSVFLRTDDWLAHEGKTYRVYKPAPVIKFADEPNGYEQQVTIGMASEKTKPRSWWVRSR